MNRHPQIHNRMSIRQKWLMLYLSIGVIGLCMILFSIWTPGTAATVNGPDINPEHLPSHSLTDNPEPTASPTPELHPSSQTPKSSPTPTVSPSPTPTSTPAPTPTPANDLLKNAYPEVNELVETYYNAKLDGTLETFEPLVSDLSAIDIDVQKKQSEFVNSYQNFNCYTQKGTGEIAYIVYVSYDVEILTIHTPAPTLDRLTLVYNEKGNLVINMADLTEEQYNLINQLSTNEDVLQLRDQESKRLEDALASDADLAALYHQLQP